jgi:hypothetical protein
LLDREAATKKAIAHLAPKPNVPLIVRAPDAPLAAGTVVRESLASAARTTTGDEWLFVADRNPAALPGHDIDYLFVDAQTGDVTRLAATSYPLVDERPLWPGLKGPDDAQHVVFSNLHTFRGKDGGPFLPADDAGKPTDPGEFISDPPAPPRRECCPEPRRRFGLLIYNFDTGPLQGDISDNIRGMASGLRANGYTVPNFPPSNGDPGQQPAIYIGDTDGRGLQQLRDFVADHDDDDDCCEEIIVYYSGHGKDVVEAGRTRTYFGLRFRYRGEAGADPPRNELYTEDFAAILGRLKSCHIHVVLDCCHAGGFIDPLFTLPGVRTVRVSCTVDELAYGGNVDRVVVRGRAFDDPFPRADGESGSEFTSGFVRGLTDNAAARPPPPPTPARELVDIGFLSGLRLDVTAIAGRTHPTGQTRIAGGCDCCEDDAR